MTDENYALERRNRSVGTPAYQSFEDSFAAEELEARDEYEKIEQDFREFYDWRESQGFLEEVRSAVSNMPGREMIDVHGKLDQTSFDDTFTAVYLEDVDAEDVQDYEGLEDMGLDAETFVSSRDEGLMFVSDGGAFMEVRREHGKHWFSWTDKVTEDGEEHAHDVFADYMEHLKNEDYGWREV